MGKKKIVEFKSNTPKISLEKHFQLENPKVRSYTRVYLVKLFHGILMTKDEWIVRLREIIR